MRAPVDDPAALEVHDLVGQRDGRLAVGDHDQGGVVAAVPEAGQDPGLDLRVHRRRRVVEDQQPRPAHQGTGQGDALALAAGEGRAALAQRGVQAVGERRHEAVGLGRAQRRPDVGVGHVGAQGDVAAHGVVEEERRLGDDRDRLGQAAAAQVAQVDAVHEDPAGIGVHEAGEQVGEGALAGRRRPDDRDRAARRHLEGQVPQQRHRGVVGVARGPRPGAGRRPRWAARRGRRTPSHRWPAAPPGCGGSRRRCAGTRRAASRST